MPSVGAAEKSAQKPENEMSTRKESVEPNRFEERSELWDLHPTRLRKSWVNKPKCSHRGTTLVPEAAPLRFCSASEPCYILKT